MSNVQATPLAPLAILSAGPWSLLLWVAGALVGAAVVAWCAYRLAWLTAGGSWAAVFVGGLVFGFLGWPGAALLLTFFVSSGLLSRFPRSGADIDPAESSQAFRAFDKGPRNEGKVFANGRNERQVFANGLVAVLAALWAGWLLIASGGGGEGAAGGAADGLAGGAAALINGGTALSRSARLAFAGAFAAAAADTWATEIGTRLGGRPRSALTGRMVAPGQSGGMSLAGTFAGMAGAALIGLVAALVWDDFALAEATWIEVAGFAGMWFDSILGASVQYGAHCATCGRRVEELRHAHPVKDQRGLRWVDNDLVNLVATAAGALLAWYLGGF